MPVVFALLCALTYGAADFFGGLSARKLHPYATGFFVQGIAVVPTAAIAFAIGAKEITLATFVWGTAGGTVGALGLLCLYTAMKRAPMTIVAPTTALVAATVPIFVGVFSGERPSGSQWLGIALALVAILVISRGEGSDIPESTKTHVPRISEARVAILASVGAGIGFGFFFVALDRAGDQSGLFPLVFGKIGGTVILSAVFLSSTSIRKSARNVSARRSIALAGLSGLLDVTANGFYLVAVRGGLLSIVSVISSLYPASTVLLANRVLKERIAPLQFGGMVAAIAAAVLVARG
jgi:drug/metabolite transporter (DMT)-like permease